MLYAVSASRPALFAGLCIASLIVAGCASDGSSSGFANLKTPFKGPSEAGFFALVRQNCAAYQIGGQPLDNLSDTTGTVGPLTAKLYRGDVSNDEYINRLLAEYPTANANVPAAGCVINQLDTCLSSDCQLTPNKSPELIAAERTVAAEQQQTAESMPTQTRGEVEQMMDTAEEQNAADASQVYPAP